MMPASVSDGQVQSFSTVVIARACVPSDCARYTFPSLMYTSEPAEADAWASPTPPPMSAMLMPIAPTASVETRNDLTPLRELNMQPPRAPDAPRREQPAEH